MEEVELPSTIMRCDGMHDPSKKCKRSMMCRVRVTCCLQTKKLSVSSFKDMGVRKIWGSRVSILKEIFWKLVATNDDDDDKP